MDETQRTKQRTEILVPKRKDFDAILNAVAKPLMQPSSVRRPKK
jgi:hypothetical protein